MTTPAWAERIVARVCDAAGVDEPEVTWRRSRSSASSSGRYITNERRLIVTAGSDRRDQRLVLLHELAHHLTPHQHHSDTFWKAAWRLFERFGLTRYALKRESGYKANASAVAIDLGIRGAKAAAKTATAKRRARVQPRGICPMPADRAAALGHVRNPKDQHHVVRLARSGQAPAHVEVGGNPARSEVPDLRRGAEAPQRREVQAVAAPPTPQGSRSRSSVAHPAPKGERDSREPSPVGRPRAAAKSRLPLGAGAQTKGRSGG